MKAFGAQMDLAWQDPEANLSLAEAHIRGAAALGARLVALPEMFATGFVMDPARAAAARELTEARLSALAQELGVAIVAGTAELEADGRGVNVALALGPGGQRLARYEKIHPFSFAGEHHRYRGGEALGGFTVDGARVGMFVCYDLRFPEVFRAAAPRTDLMVIIANWPESRRHAWRSLLVARAIECQCYVLGVNRVGEGGGLRYVGDSALIDPLGEALSSATAGEALVGGEVDPARVAELRERFPFLQDRRPEVYGRLG